MQFVTVQIGWMLGTLLVLTVLGVFSYGLFILIAVTGFLTIIKLMTSSTVQPRWRARLCRFVVFGLALAVVVITFRVIQVIAPPAIP